MRGLLRGVAFVVLCVVVYKVFIAGAPTDAPAQALAQAQVPSSAADAPREPAPKAAPKPAEKPKVAKVDKSPAMQKKRKEMLEKLMAERVFIKAEVPGTLPRVWVGPRFYGLDFDTKKSFVSVVYAYYLDGSSDYDSVRLYDGRTNKEIGSFSIVGGLQLD